MKSTMKPKHAHKGADKTPYVPQRDKVKLELDIYERTDLTEKQKSFLEIALDKDTQIMFVSGPSGSAKSFCAIYTGLQLLNSRRASDILYVRSAVESSDSKLGFLPGEANDKMAPYIQPLLDKLEELLPKKDIEHLIKDQRISGLPVGFLRGLSWNAKVIVADECISGEQYILLSDRKTQLKTLYKQFKKEKDSLLVKTYNEETGLFEDKKVLNVIDKGLQDVIKLVLGNRNIICTPNHLFLTELGWIEAKDLTSFTPIVTTPDKTLQSLQVLNEDQLQVFLGSYLGDGSIEKVGENRYRLKVIHGAKQKDYCGWKANIFNSTLKYIEKNGYSQTPAFSFTTKCFAMPGDIPAGKKNECPKWVLDKLDPRGIAIWLMDDGSNTRTHHNMKIYTCGFNLDSQKLFMDKFKSYGIDCEIKTDKKEGEYLYYYLNFNKENSDKLMKLVSPYIHNDLMYKTNVLNSNPYVFNNQYKNYRHVILDKIINLTAQEHVYDIEVEDNHNFIIVGANKAKNRKDSGVVVHNCQNMSKKELVTLMTRLGQFSKMFILGDPYQSDINGKSGFMSLFNLFNNEESKNNGIYCFEFTKEDIVRSGLIKYILEKIESAPTK